MCEASRPSRVAAGAGRCLEIDRTVDRRTYRRKSTGCVCRPPKTADTSTPAGITALAAYYTDALPPSADPETNAKAYFITAKLVTAAVMLAATADPDQLKVRFSGFVSKASKL